MKEKNRKEQLKKNMTQLDIIVKISKYLSKDFELNERVQAKLTTAIAHGLTKEEISQLYDILFPFKKKIRKTKNIIKNFIGFGNI